MSENQGWEITLARTSNMSPIGLLPYAFSFTPALNRPGAFSMALPLDDEIAYKIAKHDTCVICQRNDSVKWSGEIVNVGRDPAEMSLSISALGWLDELNHRFVRPGEEAALNFVGVTSGNIIQSLIATANAQATVDGNVSPTHLGFQQALDTQVRTRSYKRGQNYGQAVQELSVVENGVDISVNPMTRLVSVNPPTAFVDRTKVMFGYGAEPFNLANAPQSDDGTSTATRITVVGANGITVSADDFDAITAQGGSIREEWISLSDVSNVDILGAYANAELVYKRYGKVSYSLKPLPFGDVPRLYDDFELGDKVYLSIDAGALKVERQAIRVFSVSLEIDANGNETITQIGTEPE